MRRVSLSSTLARAGEPDALPLLERFVARRLGLGPPRDEVSGDATAADGRAVEIKVSLGGRSGALNFVQLRLDHPVDLYCLVGYCLHEGELGAVRAVVRAEMDAEAEEREKELRDAAARVEALEAMLRKAGVLQGH